MSNKKTGNEILLELANKAGYVKIPTKTPIELAMLIAEKLNVSGGVSLMDFLYQKHSAFDLVAQSLNNKPHWSDAAGVVDELGDIAAASGFNPPLPIARTDINLLCCTLYSLLFTIFNSATFEPSNGIVHTYKEYDSLEGPNGSKSTYQRMRASHISVLTATLNKYDGASILESFKSLVALNSYLSLYGDTMKPEEFDGVAVLQGLCDKDTRVHKNRVSGESLSASIQKCHEVNKFGYAYLGVPYPMFMELPVGHCGNRCSRFIPFLMNGLVLS